MDIQSVYDMWLQRASYYFEIDGIDQGVHFFALPHNRFQVSIPLPEGHQSRDDHKLIPIKDRIHADVLISAAEYGIEIDQVFVNTMDGRLIIEYRYRIVDKSS